MALVNPLGDLALDKTVKDLTTAIDALASLLQRQASSQPTRALQYSRTAADAMRVNIENQVNTVGAVSSGARTDADYAGSAVQMPMWTRWSWNVIEPRQQLAEAQQSNFIMSRNRWVFS